MKTLLRALEISPLAFSAVHHACRGRDTNRRVFVNLVRRDDVVVEIGANVGNYTEVFCRLTGRNGRVHAFEPVRSTFERLDARISRLKTTHAVVFNLALGDRCGQQQIQMPANDYQQASLRPHTDGSWALRSETLREVVSVTTLDNYAAEASITRLDLLKIDVEGAELLVLKGARSLLASLDPVIHIEINPCWLRDFETCADDVVRYLEQLDYTFCYEVKLASSTGYRQLSPPGMNALRSGVLAGDFLFSRTLLRPWPGGRRGAR